MGRAINASCPRRVYAPIIQKTPRRDGYFAAALAGFVGRVDAAKPQHDPGTGMGGIALDAGLELGGHRGDDTLSHAGGTRVGLDVEADAVVGDRQHQMSPCA